MKRTILEVPQGQGLVRSVVRIEEDESLGVGIEGFVGLARLLRTLVDQPHIMRHATDCPDELHIKYNGRQWVFESVSYLTRNADGTVESNRITGSATPAASRQSTST